MTFRPSYSAEVNFSWLCSARARPVTIKASTNTPHIGTRGFKAMLPLLPERERSDA